MRENRMLRLKRRGLETEPRNPYTGTKGETPDTTKDLLRATAPVLDPTGVPVAGHTLFSANRSQRRNIWYNV